MNKLTALLLSATLSLASGAALAADNSASTSDNGPANAAASAGVGTPEAKQNQAPKGVDNNDINTGNMNNAGTTGTNMGTGTGTGTGTTSGTGTATGTGTSSGTMLHPDGTSGTNMNIATSSGPQSADEIHKNTQCKDGKCRGVNSKVDTKQGSDKVDTNTDGTTH